MPGHIPGWDPQGDADLDPDVVAELDELGRDLRSSRVCLHAMSACPLQCGALPVFVVTPVV